MDSFSEFQQAALRTAKGFKSDGQKLTYLLGQLGAEAGEVTGMIAKATLRGLPVDSIRLRDEIGDVLWVLAVLGEHFGIDLEVAALENQRKLRRRFPDGYSPEADVARKDVA